MHSLGKLSARLYKWGKFTRRSVGYCGLWYLLYYTVHELAYELACELVGLGWRWAGLGGGWFRFGFGFLFPKDFLNVWRFVFKL